MVLYPAATSADSPLAHMVAHPVQLALVVLFHPPTGANTALALGQLALCGGIYIYIYMYICIYVPYVVLGHGTNLCRVQNGQDGRPLRSRCVRLKYSLRTASNEKEVVRNEAYAPTSQPGKNTGIVRRNSAN